MKIIIFDLDQTLYNTYINMKYTDIKYDEDLDVLMNMDHPIYIFSNATYGHVEDVCDKLQIRKYIREIFSRDTLYDMKPNKKCYWKVQNKIYKNGEIELLTLNEFIFFDDLLENLYMAKSLGWITVWIHPESTKVSYEYLDYQYTDIKQALLDMKTKSII